MMHIRDIPPRLGFSFAFFFASCALGHFLFFLEFNPFFWVPIFGRWLAGSNKIWALLVLLSLSFLLASGQAKGKGSDLDGVRGMFLDSADYEFLIGT
jgi:hypothetical protein